MSLLVMGACYYMGLSTSSRKKFSNNQLLFGLVCGKCMRECTIIKDLFQSLISDKYRKKTIPMMLFLPETSSQIMDICHHQLLTWLMLSCATRDHSS